MSKVMTHLVVNGGVDCGRRRRNVYDKKLQRYAKDNRTAHLTARSDKSVAYVTKGPFIATQLNSCCVAIDTSPTQLNATDPVEERTANQREAGQSCFCLPFPFQSYGKCFVDS